MTFGKTIAVVMATEKNTPGGGNNGQIHYQYS